MVFGWAPWWLAQTEWIRFLTQGDHKLKQELLDGMIKRTLR